MDFILCVEHLVFWDESLLASFRFVLFLQKWKNFFSFHFVTFPWYFRFSMIATTNGSQFLSNSQSILEFLEMKKKKIFFFCFVLLLNYKFSCCSTIFVCAFFQSSIFISSTYCKVLINVFHWFAKISPYMDHLQMEWFLIEKIL